MISKDYKEFEKKRIDAELTHKQIIQKILEGKNDIESLSHPEFSMIWRREDRADSPKALMIKKLANEIVDKEIRRKER